jgi:hypothetical protein
MSIRKLGAQTALLQALFLIATVGVWMVVMPMAGMQMSDWNNPTKSAQFLINHKSLFRGAFFFDWVFAATTFILAAVYTQRFSRRQPWLGIVIGGSGVVASALFLISGTIGVFGVSMAVQQYTLQQGLSYATLVQSLEYFVSTAAVGAVGVTVFATALASSRTKTFASWVNVCGYITGGFYVAGLVLSAVNPMLGMISIVGVLTGILFNIGVALNLTKKPHEELTLATAN